MIIDCISDLHGYYPQLDGGDLLIVAGDLTRSDQPYQYEFLYDILKQKKYKKIIIVAGNHDGCLQNGNVEFVEDSLIEYLCDSGTEFEGLKIWGSPWTLTFEGMNPKYKAFTCDTEEELAAKFALIPDDVDILVTHSPPYEIMDEVMNYETGKIESVGSKALNKKIGCFTNKPVVHIWGHIHECYGKEEWRDAIYINASHMNAYFKPVNKPIRVQL